MECYVGVFPILVISRALRVFGRSNHSIVVYHKERQVYSRRKARRRSLRRTYGRVADPADLAGLLDLEAARVEVLSVHTLHRRQRPAAIHVEHRRREPALVVSR